MVTHHTTEASRIDEIFVIYECKVISETDTLRSVTVTAINVHG